MLSLQLQKLFLLFLPVGGNWMPFPFSPISKGFWRFLQLDKTPSFFVQESLWLRLLRPLSLHLRLYLSLSLPLLSLILLAIYPAIISGTASILWCLNYCNSTLFIRPAYFASTFRIWEFPLSRNWVMDLWQGLSHYAHRTRLIKEEPGGRVGRSQWAQHLFHNQTSKRAWRRAFCQHLAIQSCQ